MTTKILIVDDEPNITDILSFNLQAEGYETVVAHDGEAGLDLALSEKPDLVFLDVMMPKMDGFEVCRRIREVSQVPIIMLTAKDEESDKVLGLDNGADDYMTKPFSVNEIKARIRSHLRRTPSATTKQPADSRLVFGDLIIDLDLYEARRSNEPLNLTRREFDLVKYLATQFNQVVSREELLEKVWEYDTYLGDLRTVDVSIRRLRTKLEPDPKNPQYILSVRTVGYRFTTAFGDGQV